MQLFEITKPTCSCMIWKLTCNSTKLQKVIKFSAWAAHKNFAVLVAFNPPQKSVPKGLIVKWHPLVGWVSVSDWSFIAAEEAEPSSNWLRPLQLPQLTRGCSQMWSKIRFGLGWVLRIEHPAMLANKLQVQILNGHKRPTISGGCQRLLCNH